MANTLDDKIEAKKKAIRKLREISSKEREASLKTIADLETKLSDLRAKIRTVYETGLDLSVFSSAMEKAMADDKPRNAIRFGHEVLLLTTIHSMEAQESLLRLTCSQIRRLVRTMERQKRALREQNLEYEVQFMNRLSTQYEFMKQLEDAYRGAIHMQQLVIARFEWKTGIDIPELSMPTLTASTSEFLSEQKSAFSSVTPPREQRRGVPSSAEFAASMRNLMVTDGAFPPPTEDDLIPSIRPESINDAVNDLHDNGPQSPVDFVMTINPSYHSDEGEKAPRRNSRRRQKGEAPAQNSRRRESFDSAETASTAGEELLHSIQSFFRRGVNKESLGFDNSDQDFTSIGDAKDLT